MSWKLEVLVEGKWSSNALRFETEQEALDAGAELLSRWFVPTDHRAVQSDDPINAMQPNRYSRAVHIGPKISHPASKLGDTGTSEGDEVSDMASSSFLGQGEGSTPLACVSQEAALDHLRGMPNLKEQTCS